MLEEALALPIANEDEGIVEGLLGRVLEDLEHGKFRQAINPYCNVIAGYTPNFLIKRGLLRENQHYVISIETNTWGDFLIFRMLSEGEELMEHPHHLLMLNLWGIFGLEGLNEIRSDGSLHFGNFGDRMIGKVPIKGGECLPFFAEVTMTGDFLAVGHRYADFQKRSAERAFEIVRGNKFGTRFSPADIFAVISETTYGDRPSQTPEFGLNWAKTAFKDLFPEAM